MEGRIEELGTEHDPAIVALLTEAFAANEDFRWLHPLEKPDREERIRASMELTMVALRLSNAAAYGFFDGAVVGVAVTQEPSRARVPSLLRRLLYRFRCRSVLRGEASTTVVRRRQYGRVTATRDFPGHFVALLAVAPSAQERGIGRQLLDHVWSNVERCEGSRGMLLHTMNQPLAPSLARSGWSVEERVTEDKLQRVHRCVRWKDDALALPQGRTKSQNQ